MFFILKRNTIKCCIRYAEFSSGLLKNFFLNRAPSAWIYKSAHTRPFLGSYLWTFTLTILKSKCQFTFTSAHHRGKFWILLNIEGVLFRGAGIWSLLFRCSNRFIHECQGCIWKDWSTPPLGPELKLEQ